MDYASPHFEFAAARNPDDSLRKAVVEYENGKVLIRVVPNSGRDIGPLLGDFAEDPCESCGRISLGMRTQ